MSSSGRTFILIEKLKQILSLILSESKFAKSWQPQLVHAYKNRKYFHSLCPFVSCFNCCHASKRGLRKYFEIVSKIFGFLFHIWYIYIFMLFSLQGIALIILSALFLCIVVLALTFCCWKRNKIAKFHNGVLQKEEHCLAPFSTMVE